MCGEERDSSRRYNELTPEQIQIIDTIVRERRRHDDVPDRKSCTSGPKMAAQHFSLAHRAGGYGRPPARRGNPDRGQRSRREGRARKEVSRRRESYMNRAPDLHYRDGQGGAAALPLAAGASRRRNCASWNSRLSDLAFRETDGRRRCRSSSR